MIESVFNFLSAATMWVILREMFFNIGPLHALIVIMVVLVGSLFFMWRSGFNLKRKVNRWVILLLMVIIIMAMTFLFLWTVLDYLERSKGRGKPGGISYDTGIPVSGNFEDEDGE